MNDNVTFSLVAIPVVGLAIALGLNMKEDRDLYQLCLASGYEEQRRIGNEMYCVKRGALGETIVTNAKELK